VRLYLISFNKQKWDVDKNWWQKWCFQTKCKDFDENWKAFPVSEPPIDGYVFWNWLEVVSNCLLFWCCYGLKILTERFARFSYILSVLFINIININFSIFFSAYHCNHDQNSLIQFRWISTFDCIVLWKTRFHRSSNTKELV